MPHKGYAFPHPFVVRLVRFVSFCGLIERVCWRLVAEALQAERVVLCNALQEPLMKLLGQQCSSRVSIHRYICNDVG